ncbi:DUF3224 domain-containing protein [Puniceicoccaceae bacterium K14]|nr:DUF3224 domain-containing protein [Puniceicoccaceae bacterium K14]
MKYSIYLIVALILAELSPLHAADFTTEGTYVLKSNRRPSAKPFIGNIQTNTTFKGAPNKGIQAIGVGERLLYRPYNRRPTYVGIERVEGFVDGRKGSFSLYYVHVEKETEVERTISVVPGSGTGELTGLEGTLFLETKNGKKTYRFNYTLPDQEDTSKE